MKSSHAVVLAMALVTGGVALTFGQTSRPAWEAVTASQVDSIEFDGCDVDDGFVAPLAHDLSRLDDEGKKRFDEWAGKLDDWEPGREKDPGQRVRNWIALCTIPDLAHGEFEAQVPLVIFRRLVKEVPRPKLVAALAWVVLRPEEGKAITSAPGLGFEQEIDEKAVRERSALYARKLLGRLIGKLDADAVLPASATAPSTRPG